MKSWIVHYKNKFPGCSVNATENSLDVFGADGTHLVSLVKNGAGQWVDRSEEMGCAKKHCTAPIPRDARVHKLCKVTGNIILDEEAGERVKARRAVMNSAGEVRTIAEMQAQGHEFDSKGGLVKKAQPQQVSAPQAPQTPQVIS